MNSRTVRPDLDARDAAQQHEGNLMQAAPGLHYLKVMLVVLAACPFAVTATFT